MAALISSSVKIFGSFFLLTGEPKSAPHFLWDGEPIFLPLFSLEMPRALLDQWLGLDQQQGAHHHKADGEQRGVGICDGHRPCNARKDADRLRKQAQEEQDDAA